MIVGIPQLEGKALYFLFVSESGSVVAQPGEERISLGGDPEDAREVAAGEKEPFFRDGEVDGGAVRVYTASAGPGMAVQVARSADDVDGTLGKLRIGLLLVGVAGIAVAALLGRLAARTAVGPVTKLTEAAEHVTATRDLSRRIEAEGDDELARLARSFNGMLSALDDSVRAQRALVADASHELRTPLTSLRTNLEVLASQAPAGRSRPRPLARRRGRPAGGADDAGRRSRRSGARRRAGGAGKRGGTARRAAGGGRGARGAACARRDLRARGRAGAGPRRRRPAGSRDRQPARQRRQVEPARCRRSRSAWRAAS